jgi:spermidine synthase
VELPRALPSAGRSRLKIVRLRRRVRILDGDDVLSEILDHPGPTDTLFDVLAACVQALAPGPRVAMLGFAGGGVVAPLRAMGFAHPIEAVDRSVAAETLFRELSSAWEEQVEVTEADAVDWLRARRRRYHLILEDLSTSSGRDAVKPPISLNTLPALVKRRLSPDGIAVTNVLPLPRYSWQRLLSRIARPFGDGLVVHLDEYVNKILLTGNIPTPQRASRRIRSALASIGSMQSDRVRVRRFTP